MQNEQQQHVMLLDNVHLSGAEEWYCPTCGRRFLIQWPPNYCVTIIDAGDEDVSHSGWTGDPGLLRFHVGLEDESNPADDPALRDWADWLDKIGFESWWDRII